MHVSTLSVFAESTILKILMVNAENRNIVLLSRTFVWNCCWAFNCFPLERGVCEQPQVKFLLGIVDGHISVLLMTYFWMLFIKKYLWKNF